MVNWRNLTLKQNGHFSLGSMGVLWPWGLFLGVIEARILGAARPITLKMLPGGHFEALSVVKLGKSDFEAKRTFFSWVYGSAVVLGIISGCHGSQDLGAAKPITLKVLPGGHFVA